MAHAAAAGQRIDPLARAIHAGAEELLPWAYVAGVVMHGGSLAPCLSGMLAGHLLYAATLAPARERWTLGRLAWHASLAAGVISGLAWWGVLR